MWLRKLCRRAHRSADGHLSIKTPNVLRERLTPHSNTINHSSTHRTDQNLNVTAKSLLTFALAVANYGNIFAAPSEKEPLEIIPGYFEGPPIQWEVKAFRDGPELHLNGTIEEVHAELLSLNPNYDADFANQGPDDDEDRVTLEKRTDFSNANTNCNFPGNLAYAPRVDQGIKYLRGVKGKPGMPAGPGACGWVSCGYNAGIWWCNDDKMSKTLNSFGSIADGAQRVRDKCSHRFSNPGGTGDIMRVKGQAFHSTHWNVIVREIKC
ncbi:hypothetical protein FDECE_6581 [Fusarium decemcellulare]|nr:hypothetical protein FDECE_6581 [Fusarium decemcellulare]